MFSKKISHRRIRLLAPFLCIALIFGISIGCIAGRLFSENNRFETFTKEIFASEVTGNTLTLHYSLADPEKLGVPLPEPSLGAVSSHMEKTWQTCEEYEEKLKNFSYSRLSTENQMTLDTLLLYFHTQRSLKDHVLLEEMLGPSLGIQAQLPVLLAEYAFYEDQDITDYLKLLSQIRPYFQSILAFEEEKSRAGYFMSDTTLDRILEQCAAFIKDPDSNYMLEIFSQKLADYGKFSKKKQEKLNARHKEILLNQVIPAYQELMAGLEALRGTGRESCGLARFPGGQQYYEYLLKSEVGSYVPVKRIEARLLGQLVNDSHEMSRLLEKNPSLLTKLTGEDRFPKLTPKQMIESLRRQTAKDFPSPGKVSYEIRYVHESMEKYLSPAFYLTPPLDTGSPNIIYINPSGRTSGLELFTTLAHEGFPGHLCQTIFFQKQNPAPIRCLLDSTGYVEGWATYTESYAYDYAASLMDDPDSPALTRMAWLSRSVTLDLYSLLDIGIHYHGWDPQKAASFLASFGIRDKNAAREIYQYIVENPVNYLKYYWGYINFLDLKNAAAKRLGDDFNLRDFHEAVLKIGPAPFPVLEKYIRQIL